MLLPIFFNLMFFNMTKSNVILYVIIHKLF